MDGPINANFSSNMFFRNFIRKDSPVLIFLIFGPSTFVDSLVLKRMDQIKELKVNGPLRDNFNSNLF